MRGASPEITRKFDLSTIPDISIMHCRESWFFRQFEDSLRIHGVFPSIGSLQVRPDVDREVVRELSAGWT